MCDGAEARINDVYNRWARDLLDNTRMSAGVNAAKELGWQSGGFARALKDVACRRARLWLCLTVTYTRRRSSCIAREAVSRDLHGARARKGAGNARVEGCMVCQAAHTYTMAPDPALLAL